MAGSLAFANGGGGGHSAAGGRGGEELQKKQRPDGNESSKGQQQDQSLPSSNGTIKIGSKGDPGAEAGTMAKQPPASRLKAAGPENEQKIEEHEENGGPQVRIDEANGDGSAADQNGSVHSVETHANGNGKNAANVDENGAGGKGEGNDGWDDDESYDSDESFDSAFERMAALAWGASNSASSSSGSISFDNAFGHNFLLPGGGGGSLFSGIGHTLLDSPHSALNMSQQGALMRLNKMLTGDDSLDTSLIDNCTEEEFLQRIAEIALSRGHSPEDASYDSIVDALLPLVQQRASDKKGKGTIDGNDDEEQSEAARSSAVIYPDDDLRENGASRTTAAAESHHSLEHEQEMLTQRNLDREFAETKLLEEIEQKANSADWEHPTEAISSALPETKGAPLPEESVEGSGTGGVGVWEPAEGDRADSASFRDERGRAGDGLEEENAGEGSPFEVRPVPEAKLAAHNMVDGGQGRAGVGEGVVEEVNENCKLSRDHSFDNEIVVGRQTPFTDQESVEPQAEVAAPVAEVPGEELPTRTEGEESNRPEEGREAVADIAYPARVAEGDEQRRTGSPNFEGRGISQRGGDLSNGAGGGGLEERNTHYNSEGRIGTPGAEVLERKLSGHHAGDKDGVSPSSLGTAGPQQARRPAPAEPSPSSVQLPLNSNTAPAPAPTTPPSVSPASRRGRAVANGARPAVAAADGYDEIREKLQVIRVQFLRIAFRLGQPVRNQVVEQVVYRLGLAEQLRGGGRNSAHHAGMTFERARALAEHQEADASVSQELDFVCTIMALGKTGVGKSATINTIFDEQKAVTSSSHPATKKVQIITGHVHGIRVRVIDTPGLLPCVLDRRQNEKNMASVKQFIKKEVPDIVLYFDRLDMQNRDYSDVPLLRTITNTFGPAVWYNAIVVWTHASAAPPPDGHSGLPLSYEMFVAHRSHALQQSIRQAAGDMRLLNPVTMVENHSSCRVNRFKERVLPNGQVWKPQLLLVCFASKILAEANALLQLHETGAATQPPGRPFEGRSRAPPLPFLLSSLLQSRAQLRMPAQKLHEEEDDVDDDSGGESRDEDDEGEEEEDDYDQLPPFRSLGKWELAMLDEDNRRKYHEEVAERERLFEKKLRKEEKKRRRELKKRLAGIPVERPLSMDGGGLGKNEMPTSNLLPDIVLPLTFDSDNPVHRYRSLEASNQWIVRPLMESNGWDHDIGYDGLNAERMFVIRNKVPVAVTGQITKDKSEMNVNLECAASLARGEGKLTMAGLDVQTIGKDIAYTVRSETRFSNLKSNKTSGGLAVTLLGSNVAAGMKIEDKLIIGKRLKVLLCGGAITGRGDVAYGGNLEASLKDREYPLTRRTNTLNISVMDYQGAMAIGANLQSQITLDKAMVISGAHVNNRGVGMINIKASSTEHFEIAVIAVVLPIVRALINRYFGSLSQ